MLAKSAAHRAESRWWYERSLDVFKSKEALIGWLHGLIPDTLSEVWSLLLLVLVGTFAVSCINTFAQAYRARLDDIELQAAREKAAKRA